MKKNNTDPKNKPAYVYVIFVLIILLITAGIFISYLLGKASDYENRQGMMVENQKLLEVESPRPGDRIVSPVLVSGKANFFEGTVDIRVRDDNGMVLGETFATATGSMDGLYPFSKSVEFDYPLTLGGTVEIFETSPKDGSEINKATIKVGFDYPAGGQGASQNVREIVYRNENPKYSFEYGSDWEVDNSKAQLGGNESMLSLLVSKNDHNFKIEMPSVWGPGACIYPDSPSLEGDFPIASKVSGEYIEIDGPEHFFRRAKNPQILNGRASWIICQKGDDGNFTNATELQVISYDAPEKYDEDIIREMDEILRTIRK